MVPAGDHEPRPSAPVTRVTVTKRSNCREEHRQCFDQAGQGHRRAALSGNNSNFLHTTKVAVSSPLTSHPVAKGKAPHSEQEQDQVAAVTAAQCHATRPSHWASRDGIHQGKAEVKASLPTADPALGIETLKRLTSPVKLQNARSSQKSFLLLNTSNEKSETETKKTIPFKIASKRIKYIQEQI